MILRLQTTDTELECIYYTGMQIAFSDSDNGADETLLIGQLQGVMHVWANGAASVLPGDLGGMLEDLGQTVDRISDLFFTSLADGYRQAGAGTDAVLVHKAALQYALRQVFNAGKQDALHR